MRTSRQSARAHRQQLAEYSWGHSVGRAKQQYSHIAGRTGAHDRLRLGHGRTGIQARLSTMLMASRVSGPCCAEKPPSVHTTNAAAPMQAYRSDHSCTAQPQESLASRQSTGFTTDLVRTQAVAFELVSSSKRKQQVRPASTDMIGVHLPERPCRRRPRGLRECLVPGDVLGGRRRDQGAQDLRDRNGNDLRAAELRQTDPNPRHIG